MSCGTPVQEISRTGLDVTFRYGIDSLHTYDTSIFDPGNPQTRLITPSLEPIQLFPQPTFSCPIVFGAPTQPLL